MNAEAGRLLFMEKKGKRVEHSCRSAGDVKKKKKKKKKKCDHENNRKNNVKST